MNKRKKTEITICQTIMFTFSIRLLLTMQEKQYFDQIKNAISSHSNVIVTRSRSMGMFFSLNFTEHWAMEKLMVFFCHYFERTLCYNNITSQTFGMQYSTKPFLFLDWKRIFRCLLHQMFPPLNAACCLATMGFLWCFRRLWDQFICVIYFPVSQHRVLLWNCGCKRSCKLALVEKFFSKNWRIPEKPKSRKTFSLSTCLSLSSILFV